MIENYNFKNIPHLRFDGETINSKATEYIKRIYSDSIINIFGKNLSDNFNYLNKIKLFLRKFLKYFINDIELLNLFKRG